MELNISVSCNEVEGFEMSKLLQYFTHDEVKFVQIRNCKNLTLDLTGNPLPIHISSFQLMNMTNHNLSMSEESLVNIGEWIIKDSNIIEDATFVSKDDTDIVLENCVFEKDVLLHISNKQNNKTQKNISFPTPFFEEN